MRRLILLLALNACGTETVELVSDLGVADTGAEDSGAADTGVREDTGVDGGDDGGPADLGAPDTGMACVCRLIRCANDPDCISAIGAGSACVRSVCEGSTGTCSVDSDCGDTSWMCTTAADSLDPC